MNQKEIDDFLSTIIKCTREHMNDERFYISLNQNEDSNFSNIYTKENNSNEEQIYGEKSTSIIFASKLLHTVQTKQNFYEMDHQIRQFFSKRNNDQFIERKITEDIIVFISYAAFLSDDPIYNLLKWGIVIFQDFFCLNLNKLSEYLDMLPRKIELCLGRSGYKSLSRNVDELLSKLIKLGFIDSFNFKIFPRIRCDYLYMFLLDAPTVINPLPSEIENYIAESNNSDSFFVERNIDLWNCKHQVKGNVYIELKNVAKEELANIDLNELSGHDESAITYTHKNNLMLLEHETHNNFFGITREHDI